MHENTPEAIARYAFKLAQYRAIAELALMTVEERRGKNVGEPGHEKFVRQFMPTDREVSNNLAPHPTLGRLILR